jgi:peptidyl-prolyl cis-trans isomerase D
MFDLFRSRDKVVRLMLGGLLVLVALSMLTYLIPSYNMGAPDDTVVAEVGKEQLSMLEVQRTIQNTLRGRQVPPEILPHMVPQIVDGMITERAIAFQAKRLGFQIKPEDVSVAIRNMLPQLFPDGQFVGREQYAAMLAQQNISISDFEADVARQILVQRMRDMVIQGVIVTPADIEQEFRRRNEKAKIEYVKLTQEKLRSQVQPSEQELKAYFGTHATQYLIPEKRDLAVLVLDQAKVEQTLAAPEAELRRAYEQNKENFRVPERVKVRHILLKTVGKEKEEAAIKTKAEGLLKQIKGGANFAELARKNSEDPGSAAKGGDLGDWVTRGQMVPEFEKAAFTLNVNQISDLVKTQYGYHIVQVLAKEPAHLQSFDEVKTQLAADWKKARVNQQLQNALDNAQAALQKNPQQIEKVAADFGMQVVRAEKVAAGDPVPEVGVNKDFEDSVAAVAKGQVSQPVALAGNKIAMALVTGVTPAHPATFEEVKDRVRDAVVRENADKLAAEKANELYQKAASMGGDLKKAAQAMGLEVKTSDEFDRQGAVEGVGQASYLNDAFAKPVGTLVGPVTIPDARVVYKVLGHNQADLAKLAEQRNAIRDELKSQKARERNALFEDGLRQTLIKEGKVRIHQDVVSRLTSSYRG